MTEMLRHPFVLLACAYLAATIVFQFRPLSTRFLRLDQLGILPRWKFFIPDARRLDLRLDMIGLVAGEPVATVPVRLAGPRSRYGWLWSPEQYQWSVLWLAAQSLALKALRDDARVGADSVVFQTLARHVLHHAKDHPFDQVRFVLSGQETIGGRGERPIFTSEPLAR